MLIPAVAYLMFATPENKISLGAPSQPVRGGIDEKSELGVKECGNLTRTPRVLVSRPVWKLHMSVTSRNWRQDLSILKTINYCRVMNLIVSREAIPTLKFWSRLNIEIVVLRHSKVRQNIGFVATSERK